MPVAVKPALLPPLPPPIDPPIMALIRMAVREDLGHPTWGTPPGDKTVELAIPEELRGSGTIVARKPGVIAGTFLLETILREYQEGMQITTLAADASRVVAQQPVAAIAGLVRALLSAERVLLNFLGHLSGIATFTRRYVDAVDAALPAGTPRPVICDTRKTTPGFRALNKYAVRCGGGVNHRMGLYDGVMLKDNHLAALRTRLGPDLTLAQLTASIRAQLDPAITLWLEVDTLDQLQEALSGTEKSADIILLDNFAPEQMHQAVQLRNTRAGRSTQNSGLHPLLEASGGITLDDLAAVARSGVDRISIGALTHSAPVLDLSMELR
jgi:nicotinate-nucleotide pyrophosphorylase (carboxylating)